MSSSLFQPAGLPELAHHRVDIMSQIRTLHAAALSVIAEMESVDVLRDSGYSSMAALLADLVRITPRRASRLVTQAGLVAETAPTVSGREKPASTAALMCRNPARPQPWRGA